MGRSRLCFLSSCHNHYFGIPFSLTFSRRPDLHQVLIAVFFSIYCLPLIASEDMRLCRGEMYQPLTMDQRLDSQVVNCTLQQMGILTDTTEKPWLRCIHESRTGRFAGIYPLAQMDFMIGGLTGDMQASAPIAIEKWYWLTQTELSDLSTLRFGAIRGSNQHVWLLSQGLNVTVESNSVEQLFQMLEGERVDVILGTGADLPYAIKRGISHYFVRYLPLHAYFSQDFLTKKPDFIDRFNGHLLECQPSGWVSLSDSDRQLLADIARQVERSLSADVLELIRHSGRSGHLNAQDILLLDRIWSDSDHPEHPLLISEILNTPESSELRHIVDSSQDILVELFLMNAQGILLASSHMTSDYWQGDEPKYLTVAENSGMAYFIDDVGYDQSSHHFLSQVSIPFRNERSELLAVLVVGIDVEKALSEAPL